ncbi:MAG: hypothetical protein CMK07_06915 [Ponticaulis sp.]|nr:hypothetical protein [Ponticaulis sp.]
MTAMAAGIILATTLVTAFISGIFGMAGGLILIGVLTALLPVATAMILHGVIQLVSNGWRAWLIREHISWPIIGRYLIGGVLAIALLVFVMWRPDKQVVYLLLGVMAFIPWIPKSWFALDVEKPFQAEILGFVAQALNTLAGVVGPVLDIFFVQTDMTRKQIVATKGATQVIAHTTKIIFWSLPVWMAADASILPPIWLVLMALPLSMLGTWLGGLVLHRMTDIAFRDWTKYLLTLVGIVYLCRGFGLL